MIKLLVISDSHGDISLFNKLYLTHQDYDFFLHCGDSEVEPYLIFPFASVKGNCDYTNSYPPSKTIKTKYGNIIIEHGSYRHDEEYILEKDALIFLFGHTHRKYFKQLDNKHYTFNPGSLTRPRDDIYGSYLEIIIKNESDIEYHFQSVNNL